MSIETIKNVIAPILQRYGVRQAAVFGSVVRGEDKPDSDIDILVEFERDDISILDFVGIKLELEEALNRKVDLVEYCTIKQIIKEKILSEQVVIL